MQRKTAHGGYPIRVMLGTSATPMPLILDPHQVTRLEDLRRTNMSPSVIAKRTGDAVRASCGRVGSFRLHRFDGCDDSRGVG